MKKRVFESTGFLYMGHDCEGFLGASNKDASFGIVDLVQQTSGVEPIPSGLETFLDYEKNPKDINSIGNEMIEQWREYSKRKFPNLIKVKITVETEVLPDSESDKYWEKRQNS